MNNLTLFRRTMNSEGIDYYLIPRTDEFQSEYLPAYAERLEFLTGFSGSAGFAIIGAEKAIVFTDGRYKTQIELEVDAALFERDSSSKAPPSAWLEAHLKPTDIIAYDPWLFTEKSLEAFQKLPAELKAIQGNLIDQIWEEQPHKPQGAYSAFDMTYAGRSSRDKIQGICFQMQTKKTDALLITNPASIAWLLNIRGKDIPYNPLLLSYCLLDQSGSYTLYSFNKSHPAPDSIIEDLKNYSTKKIWLDPNATPLAVQSHLANANLYKAEDPCILEKACKNSVELQGSEAAHLRDGFAVSQFCHWLTTHKKPTHLCELDLVLKLLIFRQKMKHFQGDSFRTICGAGDHGAIIHYSVDPASNKMLEDNQLVLVDSGGQYLDGTTDITRIFEIGKASNQMRHDYTLVLKGHIALARAIFPKGARGYQLDTLARQYIWHSQCDYHHGTGHGVGHYSCVHEGPQNCSPRAVDVPLKPGMILSNEPGLYREGEYGIRLENLVYVKAFAEKGLGDEQFYYLEQLTLVPFERNLMDPSLLTPDEIHWLNEYHAQVFKSLKALKLTAENPDFWDWLQGKCAPL